jgi:hypothetical protein
MTLRLGVVLLIIAAACGEPPDSRDRLTSGLRDSLPEPANPVAGFGRDSTHLVVYVETAAFLTVPESVLTSNAKQIAALAVRHFEKASQLDSVEVLYREPVRRGVWHIRHVRTFPVGMLSPAP